jgi:hypothetical protein
MASGARNNIAYKMFMMAMSCEILVVECVDWGIKVFSR